jgi:signal transduction histidine kinase
MTTWHVNDVLEAAVQTLVNERCRRAYIHDMRGGLQALHASLEVLARSANSEMPNVALIDKASAMAKRAMAQHEQAMTDIVNQVTGFDDAAEVVDLPLLVQQAQQFLRNDALNKGVTLRLSGSESALVLAQRLKLRSLILGLLALGIDALPSGAELHVELSLADSYALLELRSELVYGSIRAAEELLCQCPADIRPQEFVLGFARQWIMANGGRVEIHSLVDAPSGLRIYYPLAAA